jgi:hypothetical protein
VANNVTVQISAQPSSFGLTGTATGVANGATTSGSVSGIASVSVVAAPPTSPTPTATHTSSPPPKHKHSSTGHGSGSTGFKLNTGLGATSPLNGLLPLTGSHGAGAGNPGNLFPTINPSPGASGSGAGFPGTKAHAPYRARTVADILPLNTRQLGSQVAGLVVLAIGIVIAVARVSLRKPRTQGK